MPGIFACLYRDKPIRTISKGTFYGKGYADAFQLIKWRTPAFKQVIDYTDILLQLFRLCFPVLRILCVKKRLAGYVVLEIIYVNYG